MSQPGHHFLILEQGGETEQRNVAMYFNWKKSEMVSDSHAEMSCVLIHGSFNSD